MDDRRLDRRRIRMESIIPIQDSLGIPVEAYILHLPGEGKKCIGGYLRRNKLINVEIPDNVTLITTATKDTEENCPLIEQLNRSGVNYINSAKDFEGEWKKTDKIPLIKEVLSRVTTPYSLVLDANDVVMLKSIDDRFIETFKLFDCDILFNGSQYLYPKIISARIEKEHESPFVNHYLNAGVCFGYTEKLLKLYETAHYHSQNKCYEYFESEQYYVRIAIIECENTIKTKIDDGSHLFLNSHGN